MIDQVIVGVYLIITLVVGLYVGRNTRTIEDFAIGPRNFSTIVLVSTVFASVVDAGMTTGLAASTFSIGPIFLFSFLGIILSSFNVAFFIAPKMKPFLSLLSSGDIFEKLYGRKAKTLMGCSTIIESTLTAAIQIFAISEICQYFFKWPPLISSTVVSLVMIVYTFRGGIRSITATDVFQFCIMVVAIPIMCGMALEEIGGFQKISNILKEYTFYFPSVPPAERNYLEYLAVFISFALPCLYPLCIQRMLMAKDTKQIKSTFLINGLLSLPFYVSIGLIGVIAYILIPQAEPNVVFAALVNEILPVGIKGLVLAGLLAIFMSTIDSILNIGSLAIIHDVVGSILPNGLAPKKELKYLKIASAGIAFSALLLCTLFKSVMDIVFFLMVLGNSIFFPGFLWGILGVKATSRGFWTGVIGGTITLIICYFIYNLFPLYTMLLAISVNSSILIFSFLSSRSFKFLLPKNLFYNIKNKIFPIQKDNFLQSTVTDQSYCTAFFICSILQSIFPFFFPALTGFSSFDFAIMSINYAVAVVSLFMIFRELWWNYIDRIFPIFWILILIIALPTQSIYMLIKSNFSFIWVIDTIIIFPLILVLTSVASSIVIFISGLILSTFMSFYVESITPNEIIYQFGYWVLVTHSLVLAVCLGLFRIRDRETYSVTSSMLAHEANRSFVAFQNAAWYFGKFLPTIIAEYRKINSDNRISDSALDELLSLPKELEKSAIRSKYTVERIAFIESKNKLNWSPTHLSDCISNAVSDPSLKNTITNKVSLDIKSSPVVMGNAHEITQVFINLLENADHATSKNEYPKISIIITNNLIIIRDNGKGISKADLPNVFDDFFSTKSTMGQGLSFCKKIIKSHGGSITCSSILDEFTEFRIFLPTVSYGNSDA